MSLDEPELEDKIDGASMAGVAGLVLLELELEGEDGDEGDVELLPDVLPLPDIPVLRSDAPRSQAAIRLAPSARDTATARVWSFMYYLLELGCIG